MQHFTKGTGFVKVIIFLNHCNILNAVLFTLQDGENAQENIAEEIIDEIVIDSNSPLPRIGKMTSEIN